jgi:hypothetical protein
MAFVFLATFFYALTVGRGQTPGFYADWAAHFAQWSAPMGGAALFFACGWFIARGRLPFILTVWGAYVVVDVLAGGGLAVVDARLCMSLACALMGGLLGTIPAIRYRDYSRST